MTKKQKCGVQIEVGEENRVITCELPAGHGGLVHETADGEQWGDVALHAED